MLSVLWYLTAIRSEAMHALFFRVLRWPFGAAGGMIYGGMSLKEVEESNPLTSYSNEYLSPVAFIIVTMTVGVTMFLLFRSNLRWMRNRILLTILRLIGIGFAIAMVVTCASIDIETAGSRTAQWLILTLALLPFWSKLKV